jgi:DNA-binding Xre family transcriptional regulator
MDNPISRMFQRCSMAELAECTGLAWATLDSLRSGRSNPQTKQLRTLNKLAEFLELSPRDIRGHIQTYNEQRAAQEDSDVA